MAKVNTNAEIARLENLVFKTEDGSMALPVLVVSQSGDTLQPGNGGGDGGSGEVTVQNWPKTVGLGNILGGTVDPNNSGDYPKLIEPTGATAVEIQCPKDNTAPLLVSNMSMDFGDWEVYPGTSKVFYYDTLYVRLPDGVTDAQKVVYMATTQQ